MLVTARFKRPRSWLMIIAVADPVAGQGFNLTLRDAAALAESIKKAQSAGVEIGSLAMLEEYQAKQAHDQQNTIFASDVLPRLFGQNSHLSLLKSLGLIGMASVPVARKLFSRHAMGLGYKAAKIGA